MNLSIIEPKIDYEKQYLDFIDEWKATKEELVPFVLDLDYSDFALYIENLRNFSLGIGLKETFVPHSTYWLVDDERIIGVSNLRHVLNQQLLIRGGHIGYGIRPSERKKGYATILLKFTLEKARQFGITKALLTCNKDNIGSIRTIVNNNGILDSEELINGKIVQRYWITLV